MTNDDDGFELLFDALTAGRHPGPDVLIGRRPDGVVLRLRMSDDGEGDEGVQVFVDLEHCELLADVLMDRVYTAQLEKRAAYERKEFKRWEREFG